MTEIDNLDFTPRSFDRDCPSDMVDEQRNVGQKRGPDAVTQDLSSDAGSPDIDSGVRPPQRTKKTAGGPEDIRGDPLLDAGAVS